jgi:metal-responsive CopG/Arc/MetJ family transcriptional regulator
MEAVVVSVKMPKTLRDEVDKDIMRLGIRQPRNTWIIQAIQEKLAKEKSK